MAKKKLNRDQYNEEMPEVMDQNTREQVETEENEVEFEENQIAVDVAELQDELANTKARAEEYLEGWQRARAEFANYKKRVERDQTQAYQNAAGSILKRYIEIVDDLERALKNRPQEGEGAAWSSGIELIYRKLVSILESEGVVRMDPQGKEFDPNLHEAITSEENDEYESGQIIEVLQPGYMLGDRVLRPAMVRVAR